ncbi:MAG: type II toxin-antitoxin system PemK/MazF family toxin [Halolamina sp.]
MTEGSSTIYQRGDVVYGADPFKGAGAVRPWLVVSNHAGRPFYGDQYIALTLTTQSWPDGLVEIPEEAWTHGGTPEKSRIVPWGVQSLDAEDVDHWQGRLSEDVLDRAVESLVAEIE